MTGMQTPKGHTGIEQRRAERRVDMGIRWVALDRREADRRIAEPAPVEYGTRQAERRANPQPHSIPYPERRNVSPAIGQFAIADRARLVEENARLREALEDLTVRCDGDEGVRADGSNIQTIKAHAVLEALTPAP